MSRFEWQGERFAMQHLGSENELTQVLRDILKTMTIEERLECLTPEERLLGLTPEQQKEMLDSLNQSQFKMT